MSCRVPIAICHDQGTDRVLLATVRNKRTKVGLNLTGCTSTFVIRLGKYDGTLVASYTQANQVNISQAANGILSVLIPNSLSLDPKKEYFADWCYTLGGIVTRIATYLISVDGKAATS